MVFTSRVTHQSVLQNSLFCWKKKSGWQNAHILQLTLNVFIEHDICEFLNLTVQRDHIVFSIRSPAILALPLAFEFQIICSEVHICVREKIILKIFHSFWLYSLKLKHKEVA